MKKISKSLSVILSLMVVFSLFSVCSISASADNFVSFDIESHHREGDKLVEISVYGFGLKGVDGFELILHTDRNKLEYDSCRVDNSNSLYIYNDSYGESNDISVSFNFINGIETDARTELFTCYYYPLESGIIQVGVELHGNYLIEGQDVFEIDTSDMVITHYTDEYKYEIKDNEAVIVDVFDVVDETGIVTVPETVDNIPVAEIGRNAFEKISNMTGVIIPDNIRCVNSSAFKDCYSLEWIEVQGENTVFYVQSFDYLRSHVAIFGADGYEVEQAAKDAGLRYFSEKIQKGDINADGSINSVDARLALRISSGFENKCTRAEVYADMNKDGDITASDARILLRISAKLESIEMYK